MIKCHLILSGEPAGHAWMPAAPREGEMLVTRDDHLCRVTRVTWVLTASSAEAHLDLSPRSEPSARPAGMGLDA